MSYFAFATMGYRQDYVNQELAQSAFEDLGGVGALPKWLPDVWTAFASAGGGGLADGWTEFLHQIDSEAEGMPATNQQGVDDGAALATTASTELESAWATLRTGPFAESSWQQMGEAIGLDLLSALETLDDTSDLVIGTPPTETVQAVANYVYETINDEDGGVRGTLEDLYASCWNEVSGLGFEFPMVGNTTHGVDGLLFAITDDGEGGAGAVTAFRNWCAAQGYTGPTSAADEKLGILLQWAADNATV